MNFIQSICGRFIWSCLKDTKLCYGRDSTPIEGLRFAYHYIADLDKERASNLDAIEAKASRASLDNLELHVSTIDDRQDDYERDIRFLEQRISDLENYINNRAISASKAATCKKRLHVRAKGVRRGKA